MSTEKSSNEWTDSGSPPSSPPPQRPAPQAFRTTESRLYDYVYDPVYTVSSKRALRRSKTKSRQAYTIARIVPSLESIFGENQHHSKLQDATTKIGAIAFKESSTEKRPCTPPVKSMLLGRDRYKYFVYSTTSSSSPSPSSLSPVGLRTTMATATILDSNPTGTLPFLTIENTESEEPNSSRPASPLTRTQETQTDFRDSEAQTDPYSPPYNLRAGYNPQLLMLAPLTWGNGLPVGKEEVQMIRQALSEKINGGFQERNKNLGNIGTDLKTWMFKAMWLKRQQELRLQRESDATKQELERFNLTLMKKLKALGLRNP